MSADDKGQQICAFNDDTNGADQRRPKHFSFCNGVFRWTCSLAINSKAINHETKAQQERDDRYVDTVNERKSLPVAKSGYLINS